MLTPDELNTIKAITQNALDIKDINCRKQYLDQVCQQKEIREKVEELISDFEKASKKDLPDTNPAKQHHNKTLEYGKLETPKSESTSTFAFTKTQELISEQTPLDEQSKVFLKTLDYDNKEISLDTLSPDEQKGASKATSLILDQSTTSLDKVSPGQISFDEDPIDKDKTWKNRTDSYGIETLPKLPDNTTPKDPLVGKTINQYYIEKRLGAEKATAIYRVRNTLLNTVMEMKILHPEYQRRLDFVTRFVREVKAAQKIDHPNLVKVFEIGKSNDGTHYLVMEYIEGITLREELLDRVSNRDSFSMVEAVEIITPILSVLEVAHSQGVLHRNINPENILIGKDEDGNKVIKLKNLGHTKIQSKNDTKPPTSAEALVFVTQETELMGSSLYRSPEQWKITPKGSRSLQQEEWELDGRADIYSVGIILYELISGEPPFTLQTEFGLFQQHGFSTAKPLDEMFPNINKRFAAAIAKSLAKDREDRHSSAMELAKELKAALDPEPDLPTDKLEDTEKLKQLSEIQPTDPSTDPSSDTDARSPSDSLFGQVVNKISKIKTAFQKKEEK